MTARTQFKCGQMYVSYPVTDCWTLGVCCCSWFPKRLAHVHYKLVTDSTHKCSVDLFTQQSSCCADPQSGEALLVSIYIQLTQQPCGSLHSHDNLATSVYVTHKGPLHICLPGDMGTCCTAQIYLFTWAHVPRNDCAHVSDPDRSTSCIYLLSCAAALRVVTLSVHTPCCRLICDIVAQCDCSNTQ